MEGQPFGLHVLGGTSPMEIGGRVVKARVHLGLPAEVFNTKPTTHARHTVAENLEAMRVHEDPRIADYLYDNRVSRREIDDIVHSPNGCRRR